MAPVVDFRSARLRRKVDQDGPRIEPPRPIEDLSALDYEIHTSPECEEVRISLLTGTGMVYLIITSICILGSLLVYTLGSDIVAWATLVQFAIGFFWIGMILLSVSAWRALFSV